jgi:hypothetical protein
MRTSTFKVALFIFVTSQVAFALDLTGYENQCADIGFKRKTPAFGECVLELDGRAKSAKVNTVEKSKQQQATVRSADGDGAPDHQTCSQFGFSVGTPQYSDCRLKISIAKQEQAQRQLAYEAELRRYQEEQSRYEAKLADYERQKEIQKSLALMKFGLSLAGGTSPHASENFANAGRESLGMAPIQPTRPQVQNFTITNPAGRMTNCTVVGNNINCF